MRKVKLIALVAIVFVTIASSVVFVSCNKVTTTIDPAKQITPTIKHTRQPVLVNVFNSVKLHRPIRNCESGFWFCFIGGHWEVVDDGSLDIPYIDNNGDAHIFAEIGSRSATLHYPKALLSDPNFSSNDLMNLNADEEYEIQAGTTIKVGTYPVNINANDLSVNVELI